MPKYVIERDIVGIGSLPPAGLREGAQKSNEALAQIGPKIQWVESYVTKDKTYCIYIAENEDQILQHASMSGFPASKITEVKAKIDPSTAKG